MVYRCGAEINDAIVFAFVGLRLNTQKADALMANHF
jgi:hypothetical protein